jgi:hypothetical protein
MAIEQDENAGATERANEHHNRIVTCNAWLLEELLRGFIGDPFDLLQPRPVGQGYWEEATDQGISITDEQGFPEAFIDWDDLRQIVSAVKGAQMHTVRREGARLQNLIQRPI